MNIPYHWPIAGRLAKKIFNDFRNKVSYDDFHSWNSYKKYRYINKGKYPLTVEIRNTKRWNCYCNWEEELIKMNIPVDDICDLHESSLGTGRTKWEDTILTTLTHEITHYFQFYFDLGQTLNEKELHYFDYKDYSFRSIFLYLTNWTEMDADLSAIHFAKNYKDITKKTLENYYSCWCVCDMNISNMLANYIYNYFWNDIKDFELRDKIENREIDIDIKLTPYV